MKPFLFVLCLALCGCSAVMATKQPPKKDLAMMRPGVPRGLIISEFGAPIHTEQKDGRAVEIYSFRQGYGKGAKTARAVGHGVADVFTLGLWEVVGTPIEGGFDGSQMVAEVTFDQAGKVEAVKWLKEK